MTIKINYRFLAFLFFIILLLPAYAFANGDQPSGGGSTAISNPLGSVTDPREIIGFIIRALLGIVGSLALLMFIFGGFTWVVSGGNEEKIKKGKDMVIWATLGLVIIFASYSLVSFVISAITSK